MPIHEEKDVKAELESVRSLDTLQPQVNQYPYFRLSSEYFELLTYELFDNSSPPSQHRSWNKVLLMSSGSDSARDITLYSNEKLVGIVQCKRQKNNFALSAVLKEVSKCILYSEVDDELPKLSGEVQYFLTLAGQPSKRATEFFGRPNAVTTSCLSALEEAVKEVLETYVQFKNIEYSFAISKVRGLIENMKFVLLRSEDIDAWLQNEQSIASRFFSHRHLVDSSTVEAQNVEMVQKLEALSLHLASVPFVTDVDLKFIRGRIESVPESQRVSLGFASIFGFPREMFVGKPNLEKLVTPLMTALNGLNMGYIEWTQEFARQRATNICTFSEVLTTVHPFARQMILPYLSLITADLALNNLSGDVMTKIIQKISSRGVYKNDAERLDFVCQQLTEQGIRYLNNDFSKVVGEGELLELKLALIKKSILGIKDENDLRTIIKKGREVLLPHLEVAAAELSEKFSCQPSIFIMGSSGLDSDEMLSRMVDTARALDEEQESKNIDGD
ncbi:MAG: hypothetical protein F4183_05135 [Rhodothermaceae bacterium]|nr:hypothetical protein [Gammaproteobacteria bacterium]MYF63861.1 hypothetical protein [Rhodothermaceae bacterium]MYK04551.1 hypothetical protein [Gammaproteobacteria bacterium]